MSSTIDIQEERHVVTAVEVDETQVSAHSTTVTVATEVTSDQVAAFAVGPQGPPGPAGAVGPAGEPGPPGPPGAGSSTEYSIDNPASLWTVNHQMDAYPAVTTLDSTRRVIFGAVNYVDSNTVEIEFAVPVAGYVLIN